MFKGPGDWKERLETRDEGSESRDQSLWIGLLVVFFGLWSLVSCLDLQLVSRVDCVLRESFHRIQGELGEIHAVHFRRLREDIVGNGDDGAAALLGLKNIEDF